MGCIFFGAMAHGSTSVVVTAVEEVDIVGFDDFFGVTLRALRGDSVSRKEMMGFIAMQHGIILDRVAEFLGTDMSVFGTIGNPSFFVSTLHRFERQSESDSESESQTESDSQSVSESESESKSESESAS